MQAEATPAAGGPAGAERLNGPDWAGADRPDRARAAWRTLELPAGALLVLFALIVRWPDYLYIPSFTDESKEIERAVQIAHGQLLTVTNVTPFISAVYNYLVAGLLVAFGPQVYLPRLLVLVVGGLTCGAVYPLARAWGGPRAGLLAAALVAVNPAHILVNSHIAWSNCLTPLFTTLGLWQLHRAVERPSGPALARAGLLLGLALLTHPATLVILPACAAYVLWRRSLGTRPIALAAAAFLLAYSPLIVYNLATGFDSIKTAEVNRADHADGRALGPELYRDNLTGYALLMVRSVGGAIDTRPGPADYLADPGLLVWLGLLLAALATLARRGLVLPLLLVISSLLLAPLWSVNRFEPITNARYLMPAIVAALAAIAVLLAGRGGAGAALRLPAAATGFPPALLLAASCLALLVQQLTQLDRYYDARPPDNRSTLEALARLEAARQPDEVVVLDGKLNDRKLSDSAYRLDKVFEMLLALRGIPFENVEIEPDDLRARLARRPSVLAVLDRATVPRLSGRYTLTQLAVITPRIGRGERQRDAVPAWRDLPLTALLSAVDPRGAPEQRSSRSCTDCPDPAVYRIEGRP